MWVELWKRPICLFFFWLKKWLEEATRAVWFFSFFILFLIFERDHSSILIALELIPHNIVNYREDDFIKTTDEVTSEDEERKQSHKGIKTKVVKYFIAETYGVEVNAFEVVLLNKFQI